MARDSPGYIRKSATNQEKLKFMTQMFDNRRGKEISWLGEVAEVHMKVSGNNDRLHSIQNIKLTAFELVRTIAEREKDNRNHR